jgi:predicted tellurium resistance membrane protein TerC
MFEDDLEGRIEDIVILLGICAVIILKFMGIITIPWIWLLSPLWLAFAFLVLFTLIILVRELINSIKRRKSNERY